MNLTRTSTPDGTCVLTFDRPGSSANIFDRDTLEELETVLTELEHGTDVRGLVITSAKPKIFIAGADLNAFGSEPDAAALGAIVDLGHRVFARLNALRIPSVAGIHGACLGGGLELALACDWRVASMEKATKLGLPETQLGILPAWGGSTRLPKLIGLPNALGLILTGKQVVAAQALKLGLVDDLAPREYLVDTARALLGRGKRQPRRRPWSSRLPLSALVAMKARRDVKKKTRGHYPAPLKAIDVCASAVRQPDAKGFAREKAAFLDLVRTPACRSLMTLFFLQERAKKLELTPRPAAPARPVRRVAVIGAGTMGAGIAQWVSARGLPVRLKDVSPKALARGLHAIEKIYADGVKRRVFAPHEATAGLDRIQPLHTPLPMQDVDLVIEAALEQLDVKQEVFRELEQLARPDAVLATNTSALSIDAIASVLADPGRVVGLHFFNPVHRMQLVEIVRGSRTSPAALDTALQFVKGIGKLPVVVRDSPGFLVNRILLPYLVEAVWLFTEGTPAPEVDRLMLEFGMPMGPLRLCDEVGLDVAQHVAKDLEKRLPQPVPINDTLEKMIARGWLGKKSGRGFYVHPGRGERLKPNPHTRFLQAEKPRAQSETDKRDRLVLVMINEAGRVLDEHVVASPADVDFGMIMGTGWAPFRGGPLRYADTLGAPHIVRRLEVLAREVAPHFVPCERLRRLVWEKRAFYSARATGTREPAPAPAATAVPTGIDVPLRSSGVPATAPLPSAGRDAQPESSRPTAATK
jgi:3-hydroxyacyl-CoA dehydrogenase / enoyl-CoA hydratase / 3-hydroxybutyryl-CoA epimerase